MGGEAEAATYFKPAAEGKATLTVVPPPGFRTSADYASVVATVEKPGIAVAEGLIIGKDLQVLGGIALGEPAGPEGVKVTLTSSDASKLLLSTAEDKLGSGTITLTVPPGQFAANLFPAGAQRHGSRNPPGYRARFPDSDRPYATGSVGCDRRLLKVWAAGRGRR